MTLAIVMVALSVGTYITNLFGMNLVNGLEDENPLVFWFVNVGLIIMMCSIMYYLSNRYELLGQVSTKVNSTKDKHQQSSQFFLFYYRFNNL